MNPSRLNHSRWSAGALAGILLVMVACSAGPGSSVPPAEVTVIGERGHDPGQFIRPRAVLANSEGQIYVIDRSGWVQRLEPNGSPDLRWRLPAWDNGTPTGITLDEEENLWVADTHYSRVLVYSPEGELLAQWGESAAPEGEVEPGKMVFPTDLALDDEGFVYVTEYGVRVRVLKFTRAGEFITEWNPRDPETGDELLMRPMAIVSEPDRGTLLIADTGHHRLVRMGRGGEILEIIGGPGAELGQFNYPYDVALMPGGDLLVCEWGNGRVQRLRPDGTPVAQWGERGRGPGALWTPWGVAPLADGRILVADTENHRLQVFRN